MKKLLPVKGNSLNLASELLQVRTAPLHPLHYFHALAGEVSDVHLKALFLNAIPS